MLKIRFNFRQADSALELNEHFLGISTPGVKWGFEITPGQDFGSISVAPGSLLTREGVSITETDEMSFMLEALSDPANGRIDCLVADYLFEEKVNPNTCNFSIVKGTEGTDPQAPTITGDTKYEIARIGITADGIKAYHIFYPNPQTRLDVINSSFDNGEYSLIKTNTTLKTSNPPEISLTSGTAIIAGMKSAVPAQDFSGFLVQDDYFQYTVNSGLHQRIPTVGAHKIPSAVLVNSTSLNMLTEITTFSISVYKTYADFLSNTTETYMFGEKPFKKYYDESSKTVHVPIPDCVGVAAVNATGASADLLIVKQLTIVPIFAVSGGVPGTLSLMSVTGMEEQDGSVVLYSGNMLKVPSDRAMLIGYFNGFGNFRPVKRHGNRMIFQDEFSRRGLARLYHFLGHTDFTMSAVEKEPTEFFDNEDVLDIVGTHTMFKNKMYVSVYHTGSGDPGKSADYTLSING